ncbi:hypothetical protein C2E23DRAFT_240742 [Lenzites betulinus]|nr:hypothetical protein C2E23DRAFT_240742 [Lenzites betulinus]
MRACGSVRRCTRLPSCAVRPVVANKSTPRVRCARPGIFAPVTLDEAVVRESATPVVIFPLDAAEDKDMGPGTHQSGQRRSKIDAPAWCPGVCARCCSAGGSYISHKSDAFFAALVCPCPLLPRVALFAEARFSQSTRKLRKLWSTLNKPRVWSTSSTASPPARAAATPSQRATPPMSTPTSMCATPRRARTTPLPPWRTSTSRASPASTAARAPSPSPSLLPSYSPGGSARPFCRRPGIDGSCRRFGPGSSSRECLFSLEESAYMRFWRCDDVQAS